MKPLILSLLIIVMCKPERSCEGCKEVRTVPNELKTSCSIYISDESLVRYIYPSVRTKIWPGHHFLFAKIPMDGRHQYDSTYDLKSYLDMSKYSIGDSFFVRYEIRWRFSPTTFVNDTILIY